MKMIKYTTILLTLFLIKSCGSTNTKANLQNNKDIMKNLNGSFIVSKLDINESLPQELTLEFDHVNKRISGFSGCNNFSGNYTTDGEKIKIIGLVSTEMACQKNVNIIESHMLDFLTRANSFSVKDNKLILKEDGKQLLKAISSSTAKETSKTTQENNFELEYTAMSRGSYKMVVFKNNTISKQEGHKGEMVTKVCSEKDWNDIANILKNINLKTLENLVAPTQARLYDGAAHANIKITYNGKTYTTQGFDDGHPPAEIKAVCDKMLSISQNIE